MARHICVTIFLIQLVVHIGEMFGSAGYLKLVEIVVHATITLPSFSGIPWLAGRSCIIFLPALPPHTDGQAEIIKSGDKLINYSLDKVGESEGWSRLRGGGWETDKC
jgi:hypothetical protein